MRRGGRRGGSPPPAGDWMLAGLHTGGSNEIVGCISEAWDVGDWGEETTLRTGGRWHLVRHGEIPSSPRIETVSSHFCRLCSLSDPSVSAPSSPILRGSGAPPIFTDKG